MAGAVWDKNRLVPIEDPLPSLRKSDLFLRRDHLASHLYKQFMGRQEVRLDSVEKAWSTRLERRFRMVLGIVFGNLLRVR